MISVWNSYIYHFSTWTSHRRSVECVISYPKIHNIPPLTYCFGPQNQYLISDVTLKSVLHHKACIYIIPTPYWPYRISKPVTYLWCHTRICVTQQNRISKIHITFLTCEIEWILFINRKCPGGWVLSAPNFRSQGPMFESCWKWNSVHDFTVFHCTESVIIALSSWYGLTLSTLGKIFSRRHFEIFFLFFSENRIWHFMQIVSLGDNLHEMSNPVFWEKIRKITSFCRLLKMPREW